MLFINPTMLEPATVSIGLYLLAKTPLNINRNRQIFTKNPILVKKKVCKWINKNHHIILDTMTEEGNEYLLDILNLIKIIKLNPSIFVIIYVMALFLVIIF